MIPAAMIKIVLLFLFFFVTLTANAQRSSRNDGNWSLQSLVLKNTDEADLMIRTGDIDNLGFGFDPHFDPFSGRSTDSHDFPWTPDPHDAAGTDRICIPSSFKYDSGLANDGYAGSTSRPGNMPVNISIPLFALKGVKADSAALQIFIDDFQAPTMLSHFQVKINGVRFAEAEKIINRINQTGPIGKLITIRFSQELMSKLNSDSLVLAIDDPTTGVGDGFAVDFVKLLINPRIIYRGIIDGVVLDAATREPIPNATVSAGEFGTVTTDAQGHFSLANVPAGLNIVSGSATGYAANEMQVDVIANESTEPLEIPLDRSGKVNFGNRDLQEGDDLVMNNIQFEVNSANLLPAGKAELDKLVSLMKANPTMEILLSGHTSAEGSAAANRDLSLRRVKSCKDYLAGKGIDEGRITLKGYGPDKPIAPNDTEANRARNRRVEMKVTKI